MEEDKQYKTDHELSDIGVKIINELSDLTLLEKGKVVSGLYWSLMGLFDKLDIKFIQVDKK